MDTRVGWQQMGRVIEQLGKLTSRLLIRSLTALLCSYRSKVPRGCSNRVSTRYRTSLKVHWLVHGVSAFAATQERHRLTRTLQLLVVLVQSSLSSLRLAEDPIRPSRYVVPRRT